MFVSLKIFLLLTVLSIPAILSAADMNNEPSIETMMSEAESRGLSVVYNTKGRTLPLIFNPLTKLITAFKPTTVLKMGFIYSMGLYLLTWLFPTAFGMTARTARTAGFDYDYESMISSINTVYDKVIDFLQIPESECRYRAVCELSTTVATKVPAISDWAKKGTGAFFLNLANPYSKAWINGIMQIDCAVTYPLCEESPYKTLIGKFAKK